MYFRSRRTMVRHGFTLVEVLVATVVTLILIGSLAVIFGNVAEKVGDSRALTAVQDNLRHAKDILSKDLLGTTAPTTPPLDPGAELGYFELIEGPLGPVFYPITRERDTSMTFPLNDTNLPSVLQDMTVSDDTTLGDSDDVLMFTARSLDQPYVGTGNPQSGYTSKYAEIIWFMRGRTLYRRVLLVMDIGPAGYHYANIPASLRPDNFRGTTTQFLTVGNTLGDLTKRENRFGHQPLAFPHDARFWMRAAPRNASNAVVDQTAYAARPTFMMPTLSESCYSSWPMPYSWMRSGSTSGYIATVRAMGGRGNASQGGNDMQVVVPNSGSYKSMAQNASFALGAAPYLFARPDSRPIARRVFDPWAVRPLELNPSDFQNTMFSQIDPATGMVDVFNVDVNKNQVEGSVPIEGIRGYGYTPRFDDVVMTNVLSFDVKVWDPGAPIFTLPDPAVPNISVDGGQLTVLPHDPAYKQLLSTFIANGSPVPTSFGAYVDLNYMWGGSQFSKLRAPPGSSTAIGYLDRLELMEKSLNLPKYTLARPAFGGPGQCVNLNFTTSHWMKYAGNPGAALPNPYCADLVGALHEARRNNPTQTLTQLRNSGLASVYCTWSTHYEQNGIDDDRDGIIDNFTNGLDDPGSDPGVDDPSEHEAVPPYPSPLRGVQITIRAFDPDSRQIREVTVSHEFLLE